MPGMTQDTGNVVASVYGILLLVLVVVLLVRAPENSGESIVESPLVWLALLNLAAVRSPTSVTATGRSARCGSWS